MRLKIGLNLYLNPDISQPCSKPARTYVGTSNFHIHTLAKSSYRKVCRTLSSDNLCTTGNLGNFCPDFRTAGYPRQFNLVHVHVRMLLVGAGTVASEMFDVARNRIAQPSANACFGVFFGNLVRKLVRWTLAGEFAVAQS